MRLCYYLGALCGGAVWLQVFILTDGAVREKESCIDVIRKHKDTR